MKKILPFLLVSSILASCAPIYRQSVVHAPLYKEQGDLSASVHTGMNDFDGHIGGAILNNFGLVISGGTINQGSEYMTRVEKYRNNHLEILPGYFMPSDNWIFEFYGGYAFGYTSMELNNTYFFAETNTYENSFFRGNYSQFILQPGIGFSTDFFNFAFHAKTMLMQYSHNTESSGDMNGIRNLHAFISPTVTTRFGYKYFKVMMQIGLLAPLRPFNYTEYNPLNASIGLHFDIAKSYRKK
jgi:hypothetical protein